jgi:hypothetical protein
VCRTLGFILHKSDADLDEPENWSIPDGPDFGVLQALRAQNFIFTLFIMYSFADFGQISGPLRVRAQIFKDFAFVAFRPRKRDRPGSSFNGTWSWSSRRLLTSPNSATR